MKSVILFILFSMIVAGGVFYGYSRNNAKTKTLESWEITLKSTEATKRISTGASDDSFIYTAKDGSTYIVANLTIKNKGKTNRTFYLASETKLAYGNELDFTAEDMFLAADRVSAAKLNPQESITGFVAFLIPENLANGNEKVKLMFVTNKKSIYFNI